MAHAILYRQIRNGASISVAGLSDTVAGSFRLLFGRIGSLEHEAPLVELLLQYGLGDHLGFVLGDKRGGEVAAHCVFHNLIILAAAEQNADAGVFMRALAVAVER